MRYQDCKANEHEALNGHQSQTSTETLLARIVLRFRARKEIVPILRKLILRKNSFRILHLFIANSISDVTRRIDFVSRQ